MRRGANPWPSWTGLIAARETPRIATSGGLMIGVKPVPPTPPRLETVKHPPLQLARLDLARPGAGGERLDLRGELVEALLVHVPDHGDEEAQIGVHRDPDVEILLQDQPLAVARQRGIDLGVSLQGHDGGLEQEGQEGELDVLLRGLLALGLAECLELGDVGLVELGDVRDGGPAPVQVLCRRCA